jgi:hypothetical protein
MVASSRELSGNRAQPGAKPLSSSTNVNSIVSSITSKSTAMSNAGKSVIGGTKPPNLPRSNSGLGMKPNQTPSSEYGNSAKENNVERVLEKDAPPFTPNTDSQLDFLSHGELRESYKHLRKEFLNKNATVQAIQRNFETLSKLCLSEQENKQQLID